MAAVEKVTPEQSPQAPSIINREKLAPWGVIQLSCFRLGQVFSSSGWKDLCPKSAYYSPLTIARSQFQQLRYNWLRFTFEQVNSTFTHVCGITPSSLQVSKALQLDSWYRKLKWEGFQAFLRFFTLTCKLSSLGQDVFILCLVQPLANSSDFFYEIPFKKRF